MTCHVCHAETPGYYCPECHAEHLAARKEREAQREAQGLCKSCGKPGMARFVRCLECRQRIAAWHRTPHKGLRAFPKVA